MKGAVLVFAVLATECYCDHKQGCDFSHDCGENEFCFEDWDHDYNGDGYCETCPSNLNECDSSPHITSWSSQECLNICFGSDGSDALAIILPIARMFKSKFFSSVQHINNPYIKMMPFSANLLLHNRHNGHYISK